MPRVFAEFNDLLGLGDGLRLNSVGVREDLTALRLERWDGLRLLPYDHDLNEDGRRDELIVDCSLSSLLITRYSTRREPNEGRH